MTVEIPDELAGEVLRYLVLGIRERVRRDGAVVTPACQRLLYELHAASFGTETQAAEPANVTDASGVGITEAADWLGCSPQYVRALARAGRIAARRVGGRWLVDPTTYRKEAA